MLLTAGCLIIPCFRQFEPLLKPKSLSALNPFASIWCCIENMLIAAAAEWIYGVTRIPFDEEIKHLKLEWKKECILTNGNILVRFMIKPEFRTHQSSAELKQG